MTVVADSVGGRPYIDRLDSAPAGRSSARRPCTLAAHHPRHLRLLGAFVAESALGLSTPSSSRSRSETHDHPDPAGMHRRLLKCTTATESSSPTTPKHRPSRSTPRGKARMGAEFSTTTAVANVWLNVLRGVTSPCLAGLFLKAAPDPGVYAANASVDDPHPGDDEPGQRADHLRLGERLLLDDRDRGDLVHSRVGHRRPWLGGPPLPALAVKNVVNGDTLSLDGADCA